MKVNNLENKVMSLEINGNHLEQYGRKNLEITGIPDDVSDENLKEKVIQVFSEIQVNVSSSDTEACHHIGKSKNSSNINKSSLSMSSSHNIFIHENLTPMNNKIAFHCRKLKSNGLIDKIHSRDGVIHITSRNIKDGKVIKILHMSMLLDIFPDFHFGPDAIEEEHNDSLQSSY